MFTSDSEVFHFSDYLSDYTEPNSPVTYHYSFSPSTIGELQNLCNEYQDSYITIPKKYFSLIRFDKRRLQTPIEDIKFYATITQE